MDLHFILTGLLFASIRSGNERPYAAEISSVLKASKKNVWNRGSGMTSATGVKQGRSLGFLLTLLFCAVLTTVTITPAFAQADRDRAIEKIESAFTQGSSRLLLENAADRVEIALFGISTVYSKGQSNYVMQDFFEQYPPGRFSITDSKATNGSLFLSCTYWPEPGNGPLQIVLRLRDRGNVWELRDIRVDSRPKN